MIRFAKLEDIDEIMDFIDKEWRKGHILSRDRKFFEWMYVKDDRVNFAISKNERGLDGILGFVPYDKRNRQIGLTVWKALKSSNGMIGMSLLAFVEEGLKSEIIASPGVNPTTTTAIYKYFRYEVGKMNHYYRLAKRDNYYIPHVSENITIKDVSSSGCLVREIKSFDEYRDAGIVLANNAIKKDEWYINRRYFEHPVFEYLHFIVDAETKLDIVMREQEVDGHKCIRIVDLLGDYSRLLEFTNKLDNLMVEKEYEYADCYVSAIDKELWLKAGWCDNDDTEDIIPNYFAPFVRENIDLYFSSKPKGIVILRGDGDQDRPN